jgi:hypothetical protein
MTAPDFRKEAAAAYEARKELGPDYEQAVLESFVDRAAETIDRRVNERVAAILAERGATRAPQKQEPQPDNHLPLAIWSLFFGVGGSIGLTAGAGLGAEGPFIVWLGIAAVNLAYARRRRPD